MVNEIMASLKKNDRPDEPVPGEGFKPAETLLITTLDQLKAIGDPLRMNILEAIAKEALNVKQIASRLGVPPTRLYYHVTTLEENGFVTVVDTRVKSGIIEKFYRMAAENIQVDRKLLLTSAPSEQAFENLMTLILDSTRKGLAESYKSGLFDLPEVETQKSENLILSHLVLSLPRRNVPKFIDRLKELIKDLNTEVEDDDPVNYGFTIAFYPHSPLTGKSKLRGKQEKK